MYRVTVCQGAGQGRAAESSEGAIQKTKKKRGPRGPPGAQLSAQRIRCDTWGSHLFSQKGGAEQGASE